MRKMMVKWAFYSLYPSHTFSVPINTLGTLHMLITCLKHNNRMIIVFLLKKWKNKSLKQLSTCHLIRTQTRYLIPTHLTWLYISRCLLRGRRINTLVLAHCWPPNLTETRGLFSGRSLFSLCCGPVYLRVDFPDNSRQYIDTILSRESDGALHKTNRMSLPVTLRNMSLICQASQTTGRLGHLSIFLGMQTSEREIQQETWKPTSSYLTVNRDPCAVGTSRASRD